MRSLWEHGVLEEARGGLLDGVDLVSWEAGGVDDARDMTVQKLDGVVRDEEVPGWARIPYIITGYRRIGISLGQCVNSAFRIHNETVNFWSHFIVCVLFMVATPYVVFVRAADEIWFDKLVLCLYMLAAANCLASSSCFHLFGCLSHSAHMTLGRADYKGILILITASYAPALSLFFRGMPFWRTFYLTVVVLTMAKGLILINIFQERNWTAAKNSMFVFDAAWGVVPAAHFVLGSGHGREIVGFALRRISLMYGFYALGFFIYSARIPERFCLGKLDNFGHSHQLWHACVNLAAISWLDSMLKFYKLPIGL